MAAGAVVLDFFGARMLGGCGDCWAGGEDCVLGIAAAVSRSVGVSSSEGVSVDLPDRSSGWLTILSSSLAARLALCTTA